MVASGLPNRNGVQHYSAIADMALDLLCATPTIPVPRGDGRGLQLRIGLHR